ncbi:MAG: hypothetical protein U0790_22025 [Isosphaeraceae bacterium]
MPRKLNENAPEDIKAEYNQRTTEKAKVKGKKPFPPNAAIYKDSKDFGTLPMELQAIINGNANVTKKAPFQTDPFTSEPKKVGVTVTEYKASDKKLCILKRCANNGKDITWHLGTHTGGNAYDYTHISGIPQPQPVPSAPTTPLNALPSLPTITPGPPLATPITMAQTTNPVQPAEVFETTPSSWEDL